MSLAHIPTPDLVEELRAIERRLGELTAKLTSKSAQRSRSFKLLIGSVAAIGGFALGPPTGGMSAFLAGLGMVLWADGLREDAALDNERRAALVESRRLSERLFEIDQELAKRIDH
jgi:hypothetical protein